MKTEHGYYVGEPDDGDEIEINVTGEDRLDDGSLVISFTKQDLEDILKLFD